MAAALTVTFDDLLTHEVHAPTVARHMPYFRALYASRATATGHAALTALYASVVLRPWQICNPLGPIPEKTVSP